MAYQKDRPVTISLNPLDTNDSSNKGLLKQNFFYGSTSHKNNCNDREKLKDVDHDIYLKIPGDNFASMRNFSESCLLNSKVQNYSYQQYDPKQRYSPPPIYFTNSREGFANKFLPKTNVRAKNQPVFFEASRDGIHVLTPTVINKDKDSNRQGEPTYEAYSATDLKNIVTYFLF